MDHALNAVAVTQEIVLAPPVTLAITVSLTAWAVQNAPLLLTPKLMQSTRARRRRIREPLVDVQQAFGRTTLAVQMYASNAPLLLTPKLMQSTRARRRRIREPLVDVQQAFGRTTPAVQMYASNAPLLLTPEPVQSTRARRQRIQLLLHVAANTF